MAPQAMVVLRIGDAPASVVAATPRFVEPFCFVATQTMIFLWIGHTAPSVVTAMARFIKTVRLMAAQAMILFRIGHTAAAIVAAMARFIKTIRLMAAQAMIVLGIGHTAAAIVAAMTRFIKTIRLMAAQAMILVGIGHTAASVVTSPHVSRFIQRSDSAHSVGGHAPDPSRGHFAPDGLPHRHRDIVAKIEHCSLAANLIGATLDFCPFLPPHLLSDAVSSAWPKSRILSALRSSTLSEIFMVASARRERIVRMRSPSGSS